MKIDSNIIAKVNKWFAEAALDDNIVDAMAANLATANAAGRPSNRMVLIKEYGEDGFVFYTNLGSKKGGDLLENPQASLCIYWESLKRQIRIEGQVVPVSDSKADEYFASRPLKSRIGAWASKQSQPLNSYGTLLKEVSYQAVKFMGKTIERPEFWSGFVVVPNYIEFWEDGEFRVHKRQVFENIDGSWVEGQLYP